MVDQTLLACKADLALSLTDMLTADSHWPLYDELVLHDTITRTRLLVVCSTGQMAFGWHGRCGKEYPPHWAYKPKMTPPMNGELGGLASEGLPAPYTGAGGERPGAG